MPPADITIQTDQIITQVGLVAESSAQPVLINSVVASGSLETDTLLDKYGDIGARAWGNRRIVYDVELDQLAQYGVADSYPGRIDATLLANLTNNFGLGPDSGTALLTGGVRRRERAKIPRVNLTVEVEDTRNAGLGSPDGASTPSYGSSPGGTRPAITSSATLSGTIGSAFSHTITATGTATITYSLAPGQTLPAGLSLAGAVISGTPSGSASVTYVEIRASNGYGTTSQIIKLTIAAAAAAAPDEVVAYVRYLVDSDSTTILDGFWALSYSDMSPAPTDDTTFLSGTPGSYSAPATDPGLPSNPNALTGTTGGGKDWQITEILGWNGSEYEYWYQRDATKDTALLDAIDRGLDPLTEATEEQVAGEDIGTDGPGDEGDPAWPGTIEPSDRYEQYFRVWDAVADTYQVTGVGGDQVAPTVEKFLEKWSSLSLKWTETRTKVVVEIYNNFGTPGYLYQRATTDDEISTQLGLTKSPIFYAGTIAGVRGRTSLPYVAPEFTLEALPTAPGIYTGPAISDESWLYFLERLWDGGGYQIIGWRTTTTIPTEYPTIQDLCDALGKVASQDAHDERSYGLGMLVEVWAYNGTDWKAVWLDDSLDASTSLLGGFIADGISPINHALAYPGTSYRFLPTDWA